MKGDIWSNLTVNEVRVRMGLAPLPLDADLLLGSMGSQVQMEHTPYTYPDIGICIHEGVKTLRSDGHGRLWKLCLQCHAFANEGHASKRVFETRRVARQNRWREKIVMMILRDIGDATIHSKNGIIGIEHDRVRYEVTLDVDGFTMAVAGGDILCLSLAYADTDDFEATLRYFLVGIARALQQRIYISKEGKILL